MLSQPYTMSYTVAYYDGNITRTMNISSMLAVLILASEKQSEELQRGEEFVASFGLAWVIVAYEMTIHRLPKVEETLTIRTQAIAYNKYFCYRHFWIEDAAGELCVFVKADFALIDKENRKISRVLPEIIVPYESEKITYIARGEKILPVVNGNFATYQVRFFDIDSNQHVNNAVYFQWLLDVLGYDFLTHYQPTTIRVKFDKEVYYGEEIESHYAQTQNDAQTLTCHEIRIGEQVYCRANIEWVEIGAKR